MDFGGMKMSERLFEDSRDDWIGTTLTQLKVMGVGLVIIIAVPELESLLVQWKELIPEFLLEYGLPDA